MHNYKIYCDDLQEGLWFKNLNNRLKNAELEIIPSRKTDIATSNLSEVLKYDRPDIILQDDEKNILILERTIEVPSGHNVGQRYGRLLAAAELRIPAVYLGPYAAYKHGGKTAGPRYMNLRLFYSLKKVSKYFNTAITTINWPVDKYYEIIKSSEKDVRMKEYMDVFFDYYDSYGFSGLTEHLLDSSFQKEQYSEQSTFAKQEIRSPEQYDTPPDSVQLMSLESFNAVYLNTYQFHPNTKNVLIYNVGMTRIRSDPYAGMSALYSYLYCLDNNTILVLHFPHIESSKWFSQRTSSKTYRMFKTFSEAIIFKDCLLPREQL